MIVAWFIDILGGVSHEARIAAGEGLETLAYDRFKEVALGIERALERLPKGSPALSELPFLLAEVGEPGCAKLLGRFLQNEDAEVVASAIEAMAELGDPASIQVRAGIAGLPQPGVDGARDDIAWSEIAHRVHPRGDRITLPVNEDSALAANRLGDERPPATRVAVEQHGRMELDELDVADRHARPQRKRHTVAG